jgi:hypothetical protein
MDANSKSWNFEGKEYPLFPFDVPQTIKLQNGTTHFFRMWDEVTEKKKEDLMKTVIITSPAIINNEQPRDSKTDYTKGLLAYYDMMAERVSGVALNGEPPDTIFNVKDETEIEMSDGHKARILDLVSVPVKKAAASRLYGGKVEAERPEEEEEVFEGDPFAEADISAAVDKAENRKEVYKLSLNRQVVIRHEIGIEQMRNGRMTDATHLMRHHFNEPDAKAFSKWELTAFRGYSVSRPKGGDRSERFYNLDAINSLYNMLIDRIEGASISGNAIDLPSELDDPARVALLKKVPLAIKKYTVGSLFSEMNNLGNF